LFVRTPVHVTYFDVSLTFYRRHKVRRYTDWVALLHR